MRASDLRKVNGLDPHFITREELIREFVQLLRAGNGALFAGAGISMDCGLPSWMGLIKGFLKKMGFNPEDIKGLDNYDLMNWYCQFNSDRATLIQEIIHQLNQQGAPSVNHQIIARLPLTKIWTTNYDTLIETALEQQKKKVKILDVVYSPPTFCRDATP